MHGMFEMHFWILISSLLLIYYQNWRLQIPLAALVLVHHTLFTYIQNLGFKEIYYSELSQVTLTTYLFHLTLVFGVQTLAGLIAYSSYKITLNNAVETLLLNMQQANVEQSIAFAEKIKQGKLDEIYNPNDSDRLGKALLDMRESLRNAADKEEREKFITTGIAMMSEILRENANSIHKLCNKVLAGLIQYLEMNQGGVFLLDKSENEPFLNLIACYAYERSKYVEKKVYVGEGILGQMIVQSETIYMNDLPEEYIEISSGMGGAKPNCLLIVPLKSNNTFVGVIEVASFRNLEPYEITFMEKVAESIASTIMAVQSNEQTRQLLESSQKMTNQLKSQEDEMRRSVEKLQATQEDYMRREMEMKREIEKLKAMVGDHTERRNQEMEMAD
jgi:methyl-accepting chemotaxis protein